jgi:hypothetical protein
LVLQVTLTTLVTNRTVQRVIQEKELHNSLTGLTDQRRLGQDGHTFPCRHSTGYYRLRGTGYFNQAHTTVSGYKEPRVITEAWDLISDVLTRL